MAGALATRLAGSFDLFGGNPAATRTVNFIAAHDGMALGDLVAYERKHNVANGEENRDGQDENFSWNNGVEGMTADNAILDRRRRDCAALLATLFASRGTIMLTAGDEFGRSQNGNNNAYAQDNGITWLNWDFADAELRDHVHDLAALRAEFAALGDVAMLSGGDDGAAVADVAWLAEEGRPLTAADWQDDARRAFAMLLRRDDGPAPPRLAVFFNGHGHPRAFTLPDRPGFSWRPRAIFGSVASDAPVAGMISVPARSVAFYLETSASESGNS
jgi:glycogen operon protein